MKTDPVAYLLDAIQRIEAGGAASIGGSHFAGIFGKAANGFEKEVKSYVYRLLHECHFDYELDMRARIRGASFARLTLGNLIFLLKTASRMKPTCVSAHIPDKWTVASFTDSLQRINDAWVQVKHGDEIEASVLVPQMKSMLGLLRLMRGEGQPSVIPPLNKSSN